ncbi:unnamed protein product [Rhodiola kirilowii]
MVNLNGARSEDGDVCERSLTVSVKDYLMTEEMEERGVCGFGASAMDAEICGDVDRDDLATFQCITPSKLLGKWVRKMRRGKSGTARKKGGEVDDDRKMQSECLTKYSREKPFRCMVVEENCETPNESVGSGLQEQMASFRLGAGLGLALVVAASKSELDKMMELRKQMEMIVEDAKEELRCKATVCKSSQSCENPTCSTITIEESLNSNGGVSDPSCMGSGSSPYIDVDDKDSPYIEIDDKEWCKGQCKEERCVLNGMDQLESELEAELRLLELRLDSEDISRDNQVHVQESSDGGCESRSYEEEVNHANDPIDTFTEAYYGISPRELESRLHELLEAQQQERIKELEAALHRTKQKLRKKEVEVSWWKDTAHLISQHVSRTAPQHIPSQREDQAHEIFQ